MEHTPDHEIPEAYAGDGLVEVRLRGAKRRLEQHGFAVWQGRRGSSTARRRTCDSPRPWRPSPRSRGAPVGGGRRTPRASGPGTIPAACARDSYGRALDRHGARGGALTSGAAIDLGQHEGLALIQRIENARRSGVDPRRAVRLEVSRPRRAAVPSLASPQRTAGPAPPRREAGGVRRTRARGAARPRVRRGPPFAARALVVVDDRSRRQVPRRPDGERGRGGPRERPAGFAQHRG